MKHVTMFSEDIFAGLMSLIFIIDGVTSITRSFTNKETLANARAMVFAEKLLDSPEEAEGVVSPDLNLDVSQVQSAGKEAEEPTAA